MRLIDLTGQRFGRLTVVKRDEGEHKGGTKWICRCDCGNVISVYGSNLKRGTSTSCGCYRRENPSNKRHGMSGTRLYNIWSQMKDRCENPKSRYFHRYGARGISLCDEWENPEKFFRWAQENGYDESLTIDRIDNDGNYCPENCRWASMKEQENNTSRNKVFSMDGETHTLAQWCEKYGQSYKTVHKRIFVLGWDFRRAIEAPIDVTKRNRSFVR